MYSNFRFLIFILIILNGLRALSDATFNIYNVALSKSNYTAGEVISFQSHIRALSEPGVYTIEALIKNETGKTLLNRYYYGKSISSTVALQLPVFNYKVPTTVSGKIYYYLMVWKTDYSKTYATNQTRLTALLGSDAASRAQYKIVAVPPTTLDYAKGASLGFTFEISANLQSAKVNIEASIVDQFEIAYSKHVIKSVGVSNTISDLNVNYKLPTTLPIGRYKHRYRVLSEDGTKVYSLTQSTPIVFNVGTYQPGIPAAGYPSTIIKLKPRLASNPLNGGGFIPDTNVAYTMIMNDEFNGTKLDTSKWWTRFVHPKGYEMGMLDTHNDECQIYVENDTHIVSNGTLKLVARPTGKPCRGRKESHYQEWHSGMLRSKTIMKYGYFEMRVKMPSGVGVWPAFWLTPEVRGWPPEIDIFEYVINGKTEHPNMIHSGVVQKDSTAQGKVRTYKDARFATNYTYFAAPKHFSFNNDFHVISGLWNTDDTVAMYIDGVPISQLNYKFVYNTGKDAGLAHVLINLAMGGKWPTAEWTATNMTKQIQQLEVDYVRVFQRADAIKKGQSTIGRDLCPADGGC